jgi:4'-phosphopantetheinyl transferase EntD
MSAPPAIDLPGIADPALQAALDALAPPGVLIGHRLIASGDETALRENETVSLLDHGAQTRRASGAVRIVARELAARLGVHSATFPKTPSGAVRWPDGLTGSFAHDDRIALAALAKRTDAGALGIDVEAPVPLPPDVVALVVSERERAQIARDPLGARLLFAAKEAVYKAAFPRDGVFFEFSDIVVDLVACTASVRGGASFALRFCVSPAIVALARA